MTLKEREKKINDLLNPPVKEKIKNDIPINKIESRIAIPEYFNYNKYPNLKAKIQPEWFCGSI